MPISPWREILTDAATPSRLVPAACTGLVLGLLLVILELSFASLIFTGPLAGLAPAAAGLTLFGAFAGCLLVALFSSFPASIFLPQDAPAAVMASVASGIAAGIGASGEPQAAFATVAAAMALSTLATGALFLAVGRFGLGNLIRFMPFPVVGGFLAGIGWLLVQGSFSITAGVSLTWAGLPSLLNAEKILRLAPAAALAAGLLVAMKRWSSVFILPGALLLALCAFGLYLAISGQTLDSAGRAGLLLGGVPADAMLWPALGLADLGLIRWDALAPQLPQLCTIPLVSAISFLLIASGIETAARRDMDIRGELTLNAMANVLAGLGGSHAGYTALSLSLLGPRTGADSRLVGIAAALVTGAAVFCGASVLGFFPRFILGGMILFLGVATLLDWVVAARRQVTWPEYAMILAILCAIALYGFLAGVGLGLVMASALFVIKYSRLPVVRLDTDLTALRSARQRSVPDLHILREHGQGVRVLRVTGYLFFASANMLSRTVSDILKPPAGKAPGHVILDFAEVEGFDSSAVNCFLRMLQRCSAAGCRVVFAAAPASLRKQMRRAGPVETGAAVFQADLDRALEWCEDAVLAREVGRDAAQRDKLFDLAVDDLLVRLEDGERFEALLERLAPRLVRRRAAAGEVILPQGRTPDGVWLLVSGQAEELTQAGDAVVRMRSLGPGDMAGSSAPERGGPTPGRVEALTDCELAFLPAAELERLCLEDPATALAFHSLYAVHLEARLREAAKPR